jgi:hypothetical protein
MGDVHVVIPMGRVIKDYKETIFITTLLYCFLTTIGVMMLAFITGCGVIMYMGICGKNSRYYGVVNCTV